VLSGVDLVPTLCEVLSLTFEPSVGSRPGDGSEVDGMSDDEEKRR
jgi:hypothetical protein